MSKIQRAGISIVLLAIFISVTLYTPFYVIDGVVQPGGEWMAMILALAVSFGVVLVLGD